MGSICNWKIKIRNTENWYPTKKSPNFFVLNNFLISLDHLIWPLGKFLFKRIYFHEQGLFFPKLFGPFGLIVSQKNRISVSSLSFRFIVNTLPHSYRSDSGDKFEIRFVFSFVDLSRLIWRCRKVFFYFISKKLAHLEKLAKVKVPWGEDLKSNLYILWP